MPALPVTFAPHQYYADERTGKAIPIVMEWTGEYDDETCDECGHHRKTKRMHRRLDKRFKHPVERMSEPQTYYVPLYDTAD